jgi:acetyl-CoA carboxylase carboxyl transferase subunit beta
VIGPEAGAAVLYRDRARAPGLSRKLRITAADLLRLGVIDAVVPETVADVRQAVARALDEGRPGDRLSRPRRATAAALHDGTAHIGGRS